MEGVIKIQMFDEKLQLVVYENLIAKSSIKSAFLLAEDAIVRLTYMLNGKKTVCGTRIYQETCFELPNGWPAIEFFVESDKAPSKPSTPFEIEETVPCKRAKIHEQKEPNAKDLQWLQRLQQYALYYEDETKTKHCITSISKQIAATYAHGSHERLTREYTEKKPILVRCYYNEEYRVEAKVVKRNNGLDIVILQAVSENFFGNNPPTAVPKIGTRYLMLGLSNIENRDNPFSLGCGNVTAMLNDKVRYIGSSGSSNGDSGAGVWNLSGALIGMNIMVKHNPVQVRKTNDSRQKQYTHAIGGACVFVNVGVIEVFAVEYIPDEPSIPFEE